MKKSDANPERRPSYFVRALLFLFGPIRAAFNLASRRPTLIFLLSLLLALPTISALWLARPNSPPLLLAAGMLLGILLSALGFAVLVLRARIIIETSSATDSSFESAPEVTNIKALDEINAYHLRKVNSLLEVIDTVQRNSDSLLERHRILTDNLAAAIVIRDLAGKVTYASPYTEVLTGYALSEVYDSKFDFFESTVIPEDRVKYARSLKIAAMGESFSILYRAKHKTGMEMWLETRTEPVVGDQNEITALLSITIDVTRTMRYQRQVEEKNRDLQDFTYMVSHDLKAPIFTIKGMVSLLREDSQGQLGPDSLEAFEHITKAAARLESLVRSVLEYSRISAQESAQERVDLLSVFNDVANDLAEQIKSAEAALELPESVNPVVGDRLKLYQVFCNLIGNSIKFRSLERPCRITVSTEVINAGRNLLVCISDNGLGIPADKIEAIFRPFHRAHSNAIEGSGIGLACVKRLLEKLGGEISVESKEGVGSTFRVTLPCATE